MNRKILAVVMALVVAGFAVGNVFAARDKIGTTVSFLKLGAGVKPLAMGSAYAGIANDVNSIYWNPAGLAGMQKKEITAMYNLMYQGVDFSDMGYGYIAAGIPLGKLGTVGYALNYFTAGSIEKRLTDTTDAAGTFSASYMSNTLGYGIALGNLELGLGLKFINGTIDSTASNLAIGADLGVMYNFNSSLGLGLAIQNLGTPLKFAASEDPLPLNIKLGVGYKTGKLSAGVDVNVPTDNDVNFALGAEYALAFGSISLPLRLGFNTARMQDLGAMSGLSLGLGVGINDMLCFDLAWLPQGDQLGNTYSIALTFKF
ncbi:MAG: PorV/PorQ family protein [Elusimicrobiota bacterium]